MNIIDDAEDRCRRCSAERRHPAEDPCAEFQGEGSMAAGREGGAGSNFEATSGVPAQVEASLSNRAVVLIAVVAAAVIVVAAGYAWFSVFRDRPWIVEGEVFAEDLAETFITDTCTAMDRYDGKVWTIHGVVSIDYLPRDIQLAGATRNGSDDEPCEADRLFDGSMSVTEHVFVRWEDMGPRPVAGGRISVTCRIKLYGLGRWDDSPTFGGFGPEIQGYECRPIQQPAASSN